MFLCDKGGIENAINNGMLNSVLGRAQRGVA